MVVTPGEEGDARDRLKRLAGGAPDVTGPALVGERAPQRGSAARASPSSRKVLIRFGRPGVAAEFDDLARACGTTTAPAATGPFEYPSGSLPRAIRSNRLRSSHGRSEPDDTVGQGQDRADRVLATSHFRARRQRTPARSCARSAFETSTNESSQARRHNTRLEPVLDRSHRGAN